MKKRTHIKWAALAACACLSATSSVNAAKTILVDFDGTADSLGNHNAEVLKGGFTGFTNTSYSPWVSTGGGFASSLASPNGGGENYVIEAPSTLSVDTGHTIALGDTFNVGFSWRNGYNWESNRTISVDLYYTDDDTIDGTATNIVSLDSGGYETKNVWQTESATGQSFNDAAANGKKLFLKIQPHAPNGRYARVDNVYLDVTTVPEPSSTALLGLGGLALILRRRK